MLVAVATRHGDELNADFLRLYGIPDWRVLPPSRAASLCQAMICQPESWTHRAMTPHWRWADPAMSMQALQVDYLAMLMWLQSEDGRKGRNRPEPIPRPTFTEPEPPAGESLGIDIDQLASFLAAPRSDVEPADN